MPFETSWYIENRVIQARCIGRLTMDELLDGAKLITELTNNSTTPLFLLVDSRQLTHLPTNFQQALQSLDKFRANPLLVWTIVLTDNTLFKFFSALATKITHTSMRTFNTLEEANEFIAHNAPDLVPVLTTQKIA